MKDVSINIEPIENGFFVQVGNAARTFTFEETEGKSCYNDAVKWAKYQSEFQNPVNSLSECNVSQSKLNLLVERVQYEFQIQNYDWAFRIDESLQSLVVIFGSIVVSESDNGFNIELIVNWLTKERRIVCTGVSLDVAEQIVKNSASPFDSRRLDLSEINVEYLKKLCLIQ